MRPLLALVALGALAGAGAVLLLRDGDDASAVDAVRSCGSRVEGRRLRPNRRDDLVAGPIIFYGLLESGRRALADPREAFQTRYREYRVLKTITEVVAEREVTVAIRADQRTRAAMFFGLPFPSRNFTVGYRVDEGQSVVRFEGCRADHPRFSGRGRVGPRTQFNGGFLFTEPQCLHLSIRDAASTRSFAVPYGVPSRRCHRHGPG